MIDPDVCNIILVMSFIFFGVWIVSFIPRYRSATRALAALVDDEALVRSLDALLHAPFREHIEAALQFEAEVISHRTLPLALLDRKLAIAERDGEFVFRVARSRGLRSCRARVLFMATPGDVADLLLDPSTIFPKHREGGAAASGQPQAAPVSPHGLPGGGIAGVNGSASRRRFDIVGRPILDIAAMADRSFSVREHESVEFTPPTSTTVRFNGVSFHGEREHERSMTTPQSPWLASISNIPIGLRASTASAVEDPADLVYSTRRRQMSVASESDVLDREGGPRERSGGSSPSPSIQGLISGELRDELFSHKILEGQLGQLSAFESASAADGAPLVIVLDGDATQLSGWEAATATEATSQAPPVGWIRLAYFASIVRLPPAGAHPSRSGDSDSSSLSLTLQFNLRMVMFGGRLFDVHEIFADDGVDLLKKAKTAAPGPPAAASTSHSDTEMKESEAHDCVVCYARPKNVISIPCGHVCVCSVCVRRVSTCPLCRHNITDIITILR